jgi:hypothetical protein
MIYQIQILLGIKWYKRIFTFSEHERAGQEVGVVSLFQGTVSVFTWHDWGKLYKSTIHIVAVPAKMRSGHLLQALLFEPAHSVLRKEYSYIVIINYKF